MTDKEKQILDKFASIIAELPESAKEKLLFYGEGMAGMIDLMRNKNEPPKKPA